MSEQREFIILMHEDPGAWTGLPAEERQRLLSLYGAYVNRLREEGRFVYGSPCGQPQVLLHADAGGEIHSRAHAPAADLLTGFFVVRAASLEEAVELGRACPALLHGERVVVRPASH